jgi:8-amino-7-oxononanoate synthase
MTGRGRGAGPAGALDRGRSGGLDRGPVPGGALDHAPARAWLDLIERTEAADLYTFQQPLDGRAGPRVRTAGREMLLLSSYDYLGLVGHPAIEAAATAAIRRHGTGSGGVRMLTGTLAVHRELERALARFKGTEAALTFTSGYMAALGAIPALVGPRDLVLIDARAHRSTIDACRLASVPFRRFAHSDPAALEAELERAGRGRRVLIVVEGVYSMDGDLCPLDAVVEIKQRHGALLMVDEAHSFGVFGATGRGIDEHLGVPVEAVDLWMGSLSKAIPSTGGYLAGSARLVRYLQHGAAPFMFSAAATPGAAAAALAALELLAGEPGRVRRVHAAAHTLREGLRSQGWDTGASASPVIPVVLGDDEAAFRMSRDLMRLGVLASAVIHPAVPRGSARLRLCATAAHSDQDLAEALAAFRQLARGKARCAGRVPA